MHELNSAPLRLLSEDKIGPYASCAMTTVGDLPEYKYYLPRILELAVLDETFHSGTSPDGIGNKLKHGEFRSWANHEQSAVVEFFKCAFTFTCHEETTNSTPAGWIVALAELGDAGSAIESISPLTPVSMINSALAVVELIEHFERDTKKEDASAYTMQTRKWLLQGHAAEQVLLDGAKAADVDDEWKLNNAVDTLQRLKAKYMSSSKAL